MPTLIPDFARAMTESNRRAATSVEEEIRRAEQLRDRLENLRELKAEWDTLRRRMAREARAATRDILAEAHEIEELWSSAVRSLRGGLTAEEQLVILQAAADLADSGHDLGNAVRRLWALVERLGGKVEGAEELAHAGRLFERVHSEATRALEVRKTSWQPADSARLEQGRQQVREGKTVPPDEARARFRKSGA